MRENYSRLIVSSDSSNPKVLKDGKSITLKKEHNTFNFKPNMDGRCCEDVIVELSPYDLLRLSNRFDMSLREFRLKYTKLIRSKASKNVIVCALVGRPKCSFLDDKGRCKVYEDRPSLCRLFPLGMHRTNRKRTFYSVAETVCSCTKTKKRITIKEYIDNSDLRDTIELDELWADFKLEMNTGNVENNKKFDELLVKILYEFDSPEICELIEGKVGKLSKDTVKKCMQVIKAAKSYF